MKNFAFLGVLLLDITINHFTHWDCHDLLLYLWFVFIKPRFK